LNSQVHFRVDNLCCVDYFVDNILFIVIISISNILICGQLECEVLLAEYYMKNRAAPHHEKNEHTITDDKLHLPDEPPDEPSVEMPDTVKQILIKMRS